MLKLLEKFFGLETAKTETSNNILSKNDIYELTDKDFEEDLVDNGLKEAEKMLEDCLKTKKDLEDKAGKLLTAQLLIISILIAIINIKIDKFQVFSLTNEIIWWWPIFFLIIGLIGNLLCLQVNEYGSCGVHPNFFLEKETFTTKKEKFKSLKAYILVDYAKRINVSIISNERKASFLKLAICFMVSFVVTFLLINCTQSKAVKIIISLLSILGTFSWIHRTKIEKIFSGFKKIIS